MWLGNYDTAEEVARSYNVDAIRFGKQETLSFEDFCKHISNFTMRFILPSDQKSTIGSSFEIATSQYMPLGTYTSFGEANVQARAILTSTLVNQDCKMHPFIMQVDFQPKF